MNVLQTVTNAFREKERSGKPKVIPVRLANFDGLITSYIKIKHEKKNYAYFEITQSSKKLWVEISKLILYESNSLISFVLGVHDFELIDLLFKLGLLIRIL
jgi:hypothetical protein